MITLESLAEMGPIAATDYFLQGSITEGALALDRAMARRGFRGWLARRRYARIWGTPWRPLMLDAIDALDMEPAPLSMTRAARALNVTR